MNNFVYLVNIMNNFNLLVDQKKNLFIYSHLMINMHIVCSTSIILTFGLILVLIRGSFLSSLHLSAFAQTPFSTNRVTAGQQQSTWRTSRSDVIITIIKSIRFCQNPEYKTLGQMILYPIGILST
jgi:hypothetical protein